MRELMALGFEDAGSVPNQRSLRFEGKIYTEGILESLVELKREQMAAALDGAAGVETGLQLVN
jgi:hypothetical protein